MRRTPACLLGSQPCVSVLCVSSAAPGGPEDWLVACSCGVRDDDGERMAACDACGAWAHTRCAGTRDEEPVPPLFLCAACAAAGGAGVVSLAVGGAAAAAAD